MGISVQYRILTNSKGALLLSLFLLLSIVSIVSIAIFSLCMEERSQVMQEVARQTANELAVGGAWYAVHALSATQGAFQIMYPSVLSAGESIQYETSKTASDTIQVIVTATVHQPVSSMRRVVLLYNLSLKRIVSWNEV